jgi:hypothetical protein
MKMGGCIDKSAVFAKFAETLAFAFVFGFVEFHERFAFLNEIAFLLVAEGLYFEALFEPDCLFHGCGAGGFCQFDLLSVFLIEQMEVFRFVPGTHVKILIHVKVLRA